MYAVDTALTEPSFESSSINTGNPGVRVVRPTLDGAQEWQSPSRIRVIQGAATGTLPLGVYIPNVCFILKLMLEVRTNNVAPA